VFIPALPNNACACNDCQYLKLNTLEMLYLCVELGRPKILMDVDLRVKGRKPIAKLIAHPECEGGYCVRRVSNLKY